MADRSERSHPNPEEEIMRATYRALCEYGYADLTMKRIAEEYGKSTAAIHYHYDTKDDLLVAFLEFILDHLKAAVHEVETTDPRTRLDHLLDQLLVVPEDHYDLLVAMLEMRGQAPYNETFRERFERNDEYVRYMLETVIDQGREEGVFCDADAEHVARGLATIVDGARTRAVTFEDARVLETARRTADEYVRAMLLRDEPGESDGLDEPDEPNDGES
ncbi:TetR/AcrR family transcriptional regulator [Halopenitus salinus]|uniref:TetR/AcrR family transcriptional regulator n=1 Tax=Halopenitus salinus TaxID=1198295 RepID=A0ABD5UTH2_9EURY